VWLLLDENRDFSYARRAMSTLRARLAFLLPWLASAGCGVPRTPADAPVEVAANASAPLGRVSLQPISARTAESVKLRWEAVPGGFARAVAVTSSLGRVVYSSDRGSFVFDVRTGKAAGELDACDDVVRGGSFFYAGKLLVVCRDAVEFHSATDLKQQGQLQVNEAPITAAALAGSRLALAHRDGVVRVHDLASSKLIEVLVPGPPIDVKSLALDAATDRLAVAWVQGSIWWWKLSEPTVFHDLVRNENESDSLAFAPDGTLAEEGRQGFTTLWRFGTGGGEKRGEIQNGAWVKRFLFTRDSSWVVRGGSDGVDLAEVNGSRRLVLDTAGQVEDLAMDESGALIASADRAGRLMLFAPR